MPSSHGSHTYSQIVTTHYVLLKKKDLLYYYCFYITVYIVLFYCFLFSVQFILHDRCSADLARASQGKANPKMWKTRETNEPIAWNNKSSRCETITKLIDFFRLSQIEKKKTFRSSSNFVVGASEWIRMNSRYSDKSANSDYHFIQ